MPAWLVWLVAAGALAGAELLSLDLVLAMAAVAALVACVAAALGLPVAGQLLVFAGTGLSLLFLVRPPLRRRLQGGEHHPTGVAALVGGKAVVLQPVDRHGGQVKLGGEVWTARSYDPTQILEPGREVAVMEIRGATALVWGEP